MIGGLQTEAVRLQDVHPIVSGVIGNTIITTSYSRLIGTAPCVSKIEAVTYFMSKSSGIENTTSADTST